MGCGHATAWIEIGNGFFQRPRARSFHSELSEAGLPLLDFVARGKDAISAATAEAMNSAGSDLTALRADLNGLRYTVTKFISR